jgi:two-component system, cell cycle sensor histidine kinase and response regulator CckA
VSARDANGNHLVAQGALYDASEKKVLEQRAIVAQRMEATGQLAGGIAHDFNNLLGVVLTSASLLKEDLPANTESHEDVLSILRAGERGVQLTRRLLTFARGQPLETRPLTLRKLLDDMRPLLTTAVGEDVELAIIAAPHLWPVVADDAQLEQVLVNLVVNARDVMPNGGRIELCLSNDPDSLAAASRGLKPGDYVRLDVSDTGPGMPAEVANRVFEPFFTTKPRGQGTGLGLSTSFGILRDHGGHISVQSTPGLGTTFTLLLPRHAGSTLEEQAPIAAPLLQRRPGRVLLAEDDGLLRAVAQRALERAGFSVVAACSGAEALALFEREPLPPDVLVTDVVMPGMNGKELATVLKSRLPGLRVLFVSGYDESRIASRGLEESGDRFLRKPYTPATLERNVLELMSEVPSLRGESVA